jgi:hypothetical protein
MKRALAVMLFLSAAAWSGAVGASAATDNAVVVTIPFAFYAGDQLLPAGRYLIETPLMGGYASGSMVRIGTQDGSMCRYLLSMPMAGATADSDYHVTFSKLGDAYFLSQVRNSVNGAQLFRSRSHRRLSKEYAQGSPSVSFVELIFAAPRAR